MKLYQRWVAIDSYIPSSGACEVPFKVVSFRAENAHALVDLDASSIRKRMKGLMRFDADDLLILMEGRDER